MSKQDTIWLLTRAINAYNQDGDYMVAVFPTKPSMEQLIAVGVPAKYTEWVLGGGGRTKAYESEWFYLLEFPFGVRYEEQGEER